MLWKNDDEMLQLARRELFTAVVGDIMDKMGLQRQFFPPYIQPLDRGTILFGRAMTVLEADYYEEAKPFGLMLEALDQLRPNEVYVCTGGSPRYALWGELMSTRARQCGAVGAVLDGYVRDTRGILDMGFPCFARGSYAQDQAPRGKVIDFRISIEMDATRVDPGDVIAGDIDGVCVIPRQAEQEVFERALEKVRGEKVVRKALEDGMSARDAFEKYGIL
ncbi:MAG: RraA family protein [Acidobacteriia bacterium]|nr:RraA family protein [Terriglobia bacterium]